MERVVESWVLIQKHSNAEPIEAWAAEDELGDGRVLQRGAVRIDGLIDAENDYIVTREMGKQGVGCRERAR